MTAYALPHQLQDALSLLQNGDWQIIAGGTDVYPASADRPLRADMLDISRLNELKGIQHVQGGWRIGATTTWTEVVETDLPPAFDGLKAAAREVGSLQIQNAGTVAGNLCNASPAADGVPPLLTLNASVELSSLGGIRQLPLADFITGVRQTALRADEMVSAIIVPDVRPGARSSFIKLGARRYLVISIAMAAAVIDVDDAGMVAGACVAVGSCSPVARRLHSLERALIGQRADAATLAAQVTDEHVAGLSPIADVRGSAEYRFDAAAELVRRALADAVAAPKEGRA